MKTKRIALGALVLLLLACNFVTQMIVPPTATPIPTFTPTVTVTPTPTQLVPAFIPPQCESRPVATLSPEDVAQPEQTFNVKEISKSKQLRILDKIEDVVKDKYVYPDYNGKDWAGIVTRYRTMIEAGMETQEFYFQMQSMIDELQDDHSSFISPVEVEASEAELKGESEFVGVGIYSNINPDNKSLVVISTFPGSPAEYAGLQSHDSILALDGKPISPEDTKLTRGPECTAVVLKVQSPGEMPRDVIVMRTKVEGNIPIDARLVTTDDGSRIGYIFIPSFFDETLPPQIKNALQEFGQLDGLILDVRLNGGGSSTVLYPILSFFTEGRLGNFVSRDASRPLEIKADPVNNSQTVPLVVMVSEGTASFGEIFAGIMKDARQAKVAGKTSLGNVEVLHGVTFEDGSVLWIAAEKFDSAFSDTDWEQTGIITDIEAYADWTTFNFETDPSIAAALKLLGHGLN